MHDKHVVFMVVMTVFVLMAMGLIFLMRKVKSQDVELKSLRKRSIHYRSAEEGLALLTESSKGREYLKRLIQPHRKDLISILANVASNNHYVDCRFYILYTIYKKDIQFPNIDFDEIEWFFKENGEFFAAQRLAFCRTVHDCRDSTTILITGIKPIDGSLFGDVFESLVEQVSNMEGVSFIARAGTRFVYDAQVPIRTTPSSMMTKEDQLLIDTIREDNPQVSFFTS